MKCIFCNIINGDSFAEIIYQDEIVICFLDIEPINHGHLLVVPRHHYPDLPDLPDNVVNHIMTVTKLLTNHLSQTFNSDGVTIMQNNGHFNEIGHYHLHLVPRFAHDNFKWIYPEIDRSADKLKQTAIKLRETLKL